MAKPTAPRGLARERVLQAAVALFADHGVHGTSLQMIADRVGVGKAAVYYQFRSKEDIVLEVLRPTIEDISRVIRIAGALPDAEQRRAVAVSGVIEMVVRHRQLAVMFYGDPGIDQLVHAEPDFKAVADRLRALLEGPECSVADRVALSVFLSGVGKAAADPELLDIDDADLHRELQGLSGRILAPAVEDATHQGYANRFYGLCPIASVGPPNAAGDQSYRQSLDDFAILRGWAEQMS